MSKEKELLKEILSNTKLIMKHLNIENAKPAKAKVEEKAQPAKKAVAKKGKA